MELSIECMWSIKSASIDPQVCTGLCPQVRSLNVWPVTWFRMDYYFSLIFHRNTLLLGYCSWWCVCVCSHSVVSSLVLIVDPVEGFHWAILNAVLGNPLISVAATLGEDSRNDPYFLQVDLEPLVLVVELGQPGAPGTKCVTQIYNSTSTTFIYLATMYLLSGRKKKKDHQAVPKALVVEAGLLGHPGGIPAAILVLIRAADLVWCHRSSLEAQGSVIGTFWKKCGINR